MAKELYAKRGDAVLAVIGSRYFWCHPDRIPHLELAGAVTVREINDALVYSMSADDLHPVSTGSLVFWCRPTRQHADPSAVGRDASHHNTTWSHSILLTLGAVLRRLLVSVRMYLRV